MHGLIVSADGRDGSSRTRLLVKTALPFLSGPYRVAWLGAESLISRRSAAGTGKAAPVANEESGSSIRTAGRLLLSAILVFAGVSHMTWAREEFQAQVPEWVPAHADDVVVASGVVEVALGAALATARRRRVWVGRVVAAFFVAVFPGNIAQWRDHRDAFGLDTAEKRFARLFFQPVLVAWAVWSTSVGAPDRRRATASRP